MAHPRILHMITPLKHMSPFDVNMALDAGYDTTIPYTSVTVEDVLAWSHQAARYVSVYERLLGEREV